MRANETMAMFLDEPQALKDRKLFVHNLGVLLNQTRENVISCELNDNEIVIVKFKGGIEKRVNVNFDSYFAIIKDVMNVI